MKYFSQFPMTTVTDDFGNSIQVVDILERTEIIPTLMNNAQLFYSYDIQDGDTPDIISSKYYSSPDRYWMVIYSSNVLDAQGEWPMGPNLFNEYIIDKYSGITSNVLSISANTVTPQQILAYTQATIQQYIKNVTTTDSITNNSNTISYIIDQSAFANTIQGTQMVQFNTGAYSTITTTTYPQYIYDYEMQLNESKRTINLLNSGYAGTLENQLSTLLGQ